MLHQVCKVSTSRGRLQAGTQEESVKYSMEAEVFVNEKDSLLTKQGTKTNWLLQRGRTSAQNDLAKFDSFISLLPYHLISVHLNCIQVII